MGKKATHEPTELLAVPKFKDVFKTPKTVCSPQTNLLLALRIDSELSPSTIFTLFFSDLALTDLADNTNAYAASKGAGTGERSREWVKAAPAELCIFLGIIIYMGVFRQN